MLLSGLLVIRWMGNIASRSPRCVRKLVKWGCCCHSGGVRQEEGEDSGDWTRKSNQQHIFVAVFFFFLEKT